MERVENRPDDDDDEGVVREFYFLPSEGSSRFCCPIYKRITARLDLPASVERALSNEFPPERRRT